MVRTNHPAQLTIGRALSAFAPRTFDDPIFARRPVGAVASLATNRESSTLIADPHDDLAARSALLKRLFFGRVTVAIAEGEALGSVRLRKRDRREGVGGRSHRYTGADETKNRKADETA